jgi:hypothetical protein
MNKGSMRSSRCGEAKCNRFAMGRLGYCKIHLAESVEKEVQE